MNWNESKLKIAVLGQGYVGLTLSINAANAGHEVIGFDIDAHAINSLLVGNTHVPGIDKDNIIDLIYKENYLPTSNFSDVNGVEIIVISVPTPLDKKRKPDLSFLLSACRLISEKYKGSALIINESTSYPGTLRNLIKPEIEKSKNGIFQFASAPERVDPGNSQWTFNDTPRVISGINKEATAKAISFYSTFCNQIYEAPSVEVAEASKIFENTFRQINIALVNEFSEIANAIGFSAYEAITAASTKPFGFMPFYPSIGVGGHCIPVDPSYLSYISEKFGIAANFINLANTTNLAMSKKIAYRLMKDLGGSLTNKRIQIAGIAYKSDVSDMRESPVVNFIHELKVLGAQVFWCDPVVKIFNGEKSSPIDPSVDLGLIVTPHKEIDFSIWKEAGTQVRDLSANSLNFGWPKYL